MTRSSWLCSLSSALAFAACHAANAQPEPRAWEDGRAAVTLLSNAATFCVILEAETLPDWLLQDARGNTTRTRRIEVARGRPVQLLLLPDHDCCLEIPAMRVQVQGYADRYQATWFQPKEAGTYQVRVHYEGRQYEGELVVVTRDGP